MFCIEDNLYFQNSCMFCVEYIPYFQNSFLYISYLQILFISQLVWLGVSAKAASSDATVHTTTVFHSLVNVSKERPAQDHHAST
jgi:hypothetical protein